MAEQEPHENLDPDLVLDLYDAEWRHRIAWQDYDPAEDRFGFDAEERAAWERGDPEAIPPVSFFNAMIANDKAIMRVNGWTFDEDDGIFRGVEELAIAPAVEQALPPADQPDDGSAPTA